MQAYCCNFITIVYLFNKNPTQQRFEIKNIEHHHGAVNAHKDSWEFSIFPLQVIINKLY